MSNSQKWFEKIVTELCAKYQVNYEIPERIKEFPVTIACDLCDKSTGGDEETIDVIISHLKSKAKEFSDLLQKYYTVPEDWREDEEDDDDFDGLPNSPARWEGLYSFLIDPVITANKDLRNIGYEAIILSYLVNSKAREMRSENLDIEKIFVIRKISQQEKSAFSA